MNIAIRRSAYHIDFVVPPKAFVQTRDGKAHKRISPSPEILRGVLRNFSMPAYRERIYICPGENGQPAWILDFPLWWDRGAFFKKYGDRQIDTGNPFYVDYGLLLTGSEANAWDKHL